VIWIGLAPFVIAALLAVGSGRLAAQMRPSTAVRLLTALALSVSLCTGLVLSAAAVLMCAQWGPFPALGGWSAHTLRAGMGFPVDAGFIALLIVVAALAAAIGRAIRAMLALAAANRSVNALQPTAGDLVLIDDDEPTAYSIGGLRGRIVVSRSMLAALSPGERRVLIAHEESHLRHRHNLYLQLAEVASAANPLLRPVVPSIRRGIERWADEDAAAEVGDRSLAAHALARAALATVRRPLPRPALAIADDRVAERVALLLAPARPARALPIAIVLAAGLTSWLTAVAITAWANNLVQLAESAYQRH
jgi:beta-lactamase regulating signal transducer with metallopeptidase domain